MTQNLVFCNYEIGQIGIWNLVFVMCERVPTSLGRRVIEGIFYKYWCLVFGICERTNLSGKMSDRGSSFSRTATRDSFVSDMEKQPRHRHSSFLTYFCILLFCILYFFFGISYFVICIFRLTWRSSLAAETTTS